MDKKILGVSIGVTVIAAIVLVSLGISVETGGSTTIQKNNEKIGLVINSPNQATTLQELNQVYSQASNTGIGRSNVYLFWNLIEPERGEYDWKQSDVLMSFNKNNDLKVTLYFSIINGETLGPFPNWLEKPTLNSIDEDRLVSVLDAVLSRYDIIDTVILAGETESQFRYSQQNIPVYKELFNNVHEKIRENHPDVKMGNAFALHHVLNKDLEFIVSELLVGDFIAFSYSPVDSLNDIVKTPMQAREDLQKTVELSGGKNMGLFEISWSTSDFVGGSSSTQTEFLEKSFEFYSENESKLEFFTWYRQYDRPEGTCTTEHQATDDESVSVGGGSTLGGSDHVIERLNHYVCNSGLINNDGTPKSSWHEFKEQIEMINQ